MSHKPNNNVSNNDLNKLDPTPSGHTLASRRSDLLERQRSSSFSGFPVANQLTEDSQQTTENNYINKNKVYQDHTTTNDKWTEVKKKRLRDSPKTLKRNLKQTKLNNYWLSNPVPTFNSFDNLDVETQHDAEAHQASNSSEKSIKPPPIFVDKVNNVQPLIKLLNDYVNNNYEIKVLRNEQVKILSKTSEAYTIIVKQLELKGTEFYTYKSKHERAFKVILKNMHR